MTKLCSLFSCQLVAIEKAVAVRIGLAEFVQLGLQELFERHIAVVVGIEALHLAQHAHLATMTFVTVAVVLAMVAMMSATVPTTTVTLAMIAGQCDG